MTSIRFSKGNNSVELTTDHHTFSMHITSNNNAFMLYIPGLSFRLCK